MVIGFPLFRLFLKTGEESYQVTKSCSADALDSRHRVRIGNEPLVSKVAAPAERSIHGPEAKSVACRVATGQTTHHTSFFTIKKDISLCYGLGMDMVHQDFPFQSIREKEFQKRIKGMANS